MKYEIGKRVTMTAKVIGEYSFTTQYGYYPTENTIYKFADSDGKVFVWKTTGVLGIDTEDDRGRWGFDGARKGDTVTFKATVKEFGEYKGEAQTVLTRVKAISIDHAPTKEELDASKAKEQLDSLQEGDEVITMPYKQYKDHYSDCETVVGSFESNEGHGRAYIKVIVRAGRMVPSGVRGQHFFGWLFESPMGERMTFRAVSEENARKQLSKQVSNESEWKYCSRW